MSLHNTKQNFIKWSIVCSLCAAPSFMLALQSFNIPAMMLGVTVFIFLYSYANSSTAFYRLCQLRPQLKKALTWAFTLKIAQGLLGITAGMIGFQTGEILLSFDFFAGLLAAVLLGDIFGLQDDGSFSTTLLLTLAEGCILSILLLGIALFIWLILESVQRSRA